VAIYFSAEFKTELFRKLTTALNPGGYLFLGASESMHGYCDDYQAHLFDRGSVYQLK
jgi:chemotaxis protein methyltransferase CheR